MFQIQNTPNQIAYIKKRTNNVRVFRLFSSSGSGDFKFGLVFGFRIKRTALLAAV
ncbi:hypothetical protein HanHA300_Chr15g0587791 [Helianthus annuus]|nr:hypothetical protein HanHA300_Chr15g0587791 [Helianthus annuus]KAJ0475127.1 hypothetical protein HanHA89_Chr15g0637611 [Helianthus annuus]KAJ0650682.1 hypothetical protein HanLR1_Chr15g0598521 [Helianthus annuus]KAJ0654434.1 hypothetical protein HanOQP8_Chr15g0594931 [Helianthus annuus]